MAGYRQAHSRMWSDGWFAELQPLHKLLFVYLFTNERASVSGIYELPVRIIQFETGLDKDVILSGFAEFQKTEPAKVLYDAEKGVVYVHNMVKYQASTSPKVKNRIKADVASVPACALKDKWLSEYKVLIGYGYGIEKEEDGIDTSSSISIYSSISSYSSVEGEGVGEETKTLPTTPAEAASHPDIKLYREITGRFPGDRDYERIISTFEFLRAQHGDKLGQYLTPYWSAWSSRTTKDKKPYSPSSPVWYCEWAMQGIIPNANGHEPAIGELQQKTLDVIKKVANNANKNR